MFYLVGTLNKTGLFTLTVGQSEFEKSTDAPQVYI
jgi:hypothetical protein